MKLEGTWEWTDGPDAQLRMTIGKQTAVFPLDTELKGWTADMWLDVMEGRLRALAAIDACPHDDWTRVKDWPGFKRCGRCGVIRGGVVIR